MLAAVPHILQYCESTRKLRILHLVEQAWPFIWPRTTIFKAHASISLNNRILDSLPTFQFQVLLSLFRHTSVSSAIFNDAYVFLPFDTLSTLYLKEMANNVSYMVVDGLGDVVVEVVEKVVHQDAEKEDVINMVTK